MADATPGHDLGADDEWAVDRNAFGLDPDPDLAPGPLARQFAALTHALLTGTTVAAVLEEVVHAARRVVPGADIVSVTLRSADGKFVTPVHTDPVAEAADRLQYRFGEGPCVTAARHTGPDYAVSTDLATDPAWPRFGPAAAGLGMGSLLATALLPDVAPPRLSGALNVYSREPGGLGAVDLALALLLATHASLALAHVEAVTLAELQAANLRTAIDSRDVIGQAKGILMSRRGISAQEAFDVLRRASQDLNVKLVDLAVTVATRHRDLDLPAGGC